MSDQWTTPYGDVPPTQNQPPQQWPSYPPPPQSSYPPPPWQNQPPANRSWNGLAIAALVLGILPGAVVAIGLGVGALVQIGNRGGRGKAMAIVGVVLGSLWTLLIVLVIIGSLLPDPDPQTSTPPGAERHDVTTLKVGECTAKLPESDRIVDVPVIDCAKPHRDEVYAIGTIPGSTYPGDSQVEEQANKICEDKLGDRDLPAGSQMYYLAPTRFIWATGDHTVTCLVEFPKDRSGRLLPG